MITQTSGNNRIAPIVEQSQPAIQPPVKQTEKKEREHIDGGAVTPQVTIDCQTVTITIQLKGYTIAEKSNVFATTHGWITLANGTRLSVNLIKYR